MTLSQEDSRFLPLPEIEVGTLPWLWQGGGGNKKWFFLWKPEINLEILKKRTFNMEEVVNGEC